MCYASSGPGGSHLSFEECVRSIDRLVEVEGRAEVLQLSGGEPTIHPEFLRVLDYAVAPADRHRDDQHQRHPPGPRRADARRHRRRTRPRVEVYFQFDGFDDRGSEALRGESLVETKLKAIEALGRRGIKTSLVCTLQPGVNDHEIGDDRPVRGRAALDHRHQLPAGDLFGPARPARGAGAADHLPRRHPAIAEQTGGMFREDDFLPLPCAHPNCHSLTYAFRSGGKVVPLTRFIDARKHLDILANGILFTPQPRPGS